MPPEKVQIHVRLNQDLVEDVDRYAEQRGITRPAAISILLSKGLGRITNGDTDKQ